MDRQVPKSYSSQPSTVQVCICFVEGTRRRWDTLKGKVVQPFNLAGCQLVTQPSIILTPATSDKYCLTIAESIQYYHRKFTYISELTEIVLAPSGSLMNVAWRARLSKWCGDSGLIFQFYLNSKLTIQISGFSRLFMKSLRLRFLVSQAWLEGAQAIFGKKTSAIVTQYLQTSSVERIITI